MVTRRCGIIRCIKKNHTSGVADLGCFFVNKKNNSITRTVTQHELGTETSPRNETSRISLSALLSSRYSSSNKELGRQDLRGQSCRNSSDFSYLSRTPDHTDCRLGSFFHVQASKVFKSFDSISMISGNTITTARQEYCHRSFVKCPESESSVVERHCIMSPCNNFSRSKSSR